MTAGFDGVELHAAAGYLPAQFLHDGSNHRTDRYGGSIENRVRFTLETFEAISIVWGENRVGIKISPQISLEDSDPLKLFQTLVTQLNRFDLAFLQVMERHFGNGKQPSIDHSILRELYKGTYTDFNNPCRKRQAYFIGIILIPLK